MLLLLIEVIRKFIKRLKFILIIFPFFVFGQYDFGNEATLQRIKKDMAVLTADSLKGREAGTVYEIKARDYIASIFKEIKLEPITGDSSYFQPFYVPNYRKNCYNVCGYLNNNASKTVVIGAHYDHVGMGNFGSRCCSGNIHSGADDNASGVVTVIEMARYLSEQINLKYNYIFVAFSAEELGLYGSEFFVKSKLMQNLDVSYMINFDMVGRYNYDKKKRFILFGSASSKSWKKVIKRTQDHSFRIKKISFGPPFSDHSAFYNKNIPILYFTSGIPSEYHTPYDTYKTINFDGIVELINYLKKLTREIENENEIEFTKINKIKVIRSYIFSLTMML